MIIDLVDKLIDRSIQLLTHRKQMRKELLDSYVNPVYSEFEKVHSAYLESFSRYRDLIQTIQESSWIKDLQSIIEKDNLFSANARSKVVRLAEVEAEDNDILDPFIKGICEYLMGARLVDPLGKKVHPLHTQRWRQSFIVTLGKIESEHWQMVIDPDGAMPPLTQEEIKQEIEQICKRYPSNAELEGLKRSCALWALDSIVNEMQYQYDQICQTYVELKGVLSK